jgi:hypothetical protein
MIVAAYVSFTTLAWSVTVMHPEPSIASIAPSPSPVVDAVGSDTTDTIVTMQDRVQGAMTEAALVPATANLHYEILYMNTAEWPWRHVDAALVVVVLSQRPCHTPYATYVARSHISHITSQCRVKVTRVKVTATATVTDSLHDDATPPMRNILCMYAVGTRKKSECHAS